VRKGLGYPVLISAAVVLFLGYLQSRKNRSDSTVETYGKILAQFIDFLGDKSIELLTIDDIDQYADFLFSRGCAVKTRRNKLATLRSFVRYLYIKDLSDIRPEKVELPEVKHIEANFLTTEEAQGFLKTVNDVRDRALLLTLLTSWSRISECLNIQLEDIYKGSIIIREGKGGKPRVVFINKETEKAISKYIKEIRGDNPGYLFLNRYGEQLHREMVGKLIRRYADQAGIKKRVSCHTLRHTGATGFIEAGGRLEEAQQILGHTNIYTTRMYLHFTNDRLKNSYNEVTEVDKYTQSISSAAL
jgi:integrase/recombinase XerD